MFFFFSSRRRHTRYWRDWSSDVCSSDLSAPDFLEMHRNPPVRRLRVPPFLVLQSSAPRSAGTASSDWGHGVRARSRAGWAAGVVAMAVAGSALAAPAPAAPRRPPDCPTTRLPPTIAPGPAVQRNGV